MQPPSEIQPLCQALLEGLRAILGAKLYGVYLYGAAAFPDAAPTGDVDLHVILASSLSDADIAQLNGLYATLAREHPPLGAELDAYFILLDDARKTTPPPHQLHPDIVDEAWALHRAHIRAGRCIALYGPDPASVYPLATWPELEDALDKELAFVERHLDDYPDYCILNLCRLMYSFQTGQVVVSKAAAAAWAVDAFPRWRRHVELALESYARKATPQDRQFMAAEVRAFYAFACRHIQSCRTSNRTQIHTDER